METYDITVKPRRGGCSMTMEINTKNLTKTFQQFDRNLNLVVVDFKLVSNVKQEI